MHDASIRTKIKAELNCPLTEGLNLDTWEDLELKIMGRDVTNYSTNIVIISNKIKDGNEVGVQPFLTFKKTGKGACIYISPSLTKDVLNKSKKISTILKNSLSEKTLNWLCE